ncbi:response regulator transcription factor [Candidatus Pacearchaeota archaeon]|nr:response regulator transcription factor [Candidatus Pacearchaeota archaeon]
MFKALIVENNATFRNFLRTILYSQIPPFIIGEASKEEEVFRQIDSLHPDILFLNIKLPGTNGLKLTKQIKDLYPKICITILTSYDLPEYQEAAYKQGADYFISKSTLTEDNLSDLIQSILLRRQHNCCKLKQNI